MKRARAALPLLAAALAACATPATVLVSGDYASAKIKRVALVGFDDFSGAPGSGDVASSAFEKYLLLPGYALVERRQVDALMKEHGLDMSGAVAPGGSYGKILGVDALVLGTITDFTAPSDETVMMDVPQEQTDPVYGQVTTTQHVGGRGGGSMTTVQNVVTGYATTETDSQVAETEFVPAHVGLSARLVDASTGEVLWSVSASADGSSTGEAVEAASASAMHAVDDRLKKTAPH
jgi:curli biogenesis system outer membrane secretion channel CsgG